MLLQTSSARYLLQSSSDRYSIAGRSSLSLLLLLLVL
jgi:hypothetical protein